MFGEWRSRDMTMCLALPTTKALALATSGMLFTQILRLPMHPTDPPLALWLQTIRWMSVCSGALKARLCRWYLPLLNGGLLSWQLMNLRVVELPQSMTGKIECSEVLSLMPLCRFGVVLVRRHLWQECARTLSRPGMLRIGGCPLKPPWTCPPLANAHAATWVLFRGWDGHWLLWSN